MTFERYCHRCGAATAAPHPSWSGRCDACKLVLFCYMCGEAMPKPYREASRNGQARICHACKTDAYRRRIATAAASTPREVRSEAARKGAETRRRRKAQIEAAAEERRLIALWRQERGHLCWGCGCDLSNRPKQAKRCGRCAKARKTHWVFLDRNGLSAEQHPYPDEPYAPDFEAMRAREREGAEGGFAAADAVRTASQ